MRNKITSDKTKCPLRNTCIPYKSNALNYAWMETFCEKNYKGCPIRKDLHYNIELSGGYPGKDE